MLGGGVESEVQRALPAHPHEWVLPPTPHPRFLWNCGWSFRPSILHSKGFGGEAQTSTPPPPPPHTHTPHPHIHPRTFFWFRNPLLCHPGPDWFSMVARAVFCGYASTLHCETIKWVCQRNCWMVVRFALQTSPVATCFCLFVCLFICGNSYLVFLELTLNSFPYNLFLLSQVFTFRLTLFLFVSTCLQTVTFLLWGEGKAVSL